MRLAVSLLVAVSILTPSAHALDRPWISDTFFYWYTWDYDRELGGWLGGVHNTPLGGYYDSRTFKDNRRSLWQAEEWGLTHHWIDYWGHGWLGENGEPRERTVLRAAEDVRKAGYDLTMGYYQDGNNFEMTEFSKNVSEKRDVYDWLRNYAGSPAWARYRGKPYQLVYGRNGRPETTLDQPGFHKFLQARFGSVDRLNREWGAAFSSFADIDMDFNAVGPQRAWSIKYQYEIWRREWDKLDALVKREFGYPGMCASFDVGYQPYRGFGYSDFARVLGGPHSYGGIFGPPEDQDVQRFIQAAVAKRYDTVFFDHFKNYYHDWDIRVPGFAYLPEPVHFDRFWVGALMRYSEALLHLSWNEWWEGSNLEPSREWGKTYCEKNLFYATLMKRCFPSIHDWNRGARAAVLLNDWHWLAGGRDDGDIYRLVQLMRRANVRFDLLPDDFVTPAELSRFKVVFAPAAGTGFGYNREGARITDVLADWVRADENRRLVVSWHPSLAGTLGVTAGPPTRRQRKPGPDLNVFVDVGAPGDDTFLLGGYSQRENWGKLPAGTFGAGTGLTCRWTPASGAETTFLFPASPHRNHVLRFRGSALWGNRLEVWIEGKLVGTVTLRPGLNEYQLPAPADVIGDALVVEARFKYARKNVPHERDPKRFPSERRVCNLALDWLQFSTDNVPPHTTVQHYSLPQADVRFLAGPLRSLPTRATRGLSRLPRPLTAPGAQVLSRYSLTAAPRDLTAPVGKGTCWIVNGSFAQITDRDYVQALLRWAGVHPDGRVDGRQVLGTFLRAGDTVIALVRNETPGDPCEVHIAPPAGKSPVSSIRVLSRDGRPGGPLSLSRGLARDSLKYYGVYEIVRSPVRVTMPPLTFELGETRTVPVTVKNISRAPVSARLQLTSVIPTVTGKPVMLRKLRPGRRATVPLPVTVASTADWGRKTVAIEVQCQGRASYLFRPLVVCRNPDISLRPVPDGHGRLRLAVTNSSTRYGRTATAAEVTLQANGATVSVGTLAGGETRTVALPVEFCSQPGATTSLSVRYRTAAGVHEKTESLFLPRWGEGSRAMSGAALPIRVCNPLARGVENWPVSVSLPTPLPPGSPLTVRDEEGSAVPCQRLADGRLCFVASLPRRAVRSYYVSRTRSRLTSDLQVETEALGTGRGWVKVSNSCFRVTLSETAGGVVTHFVSVRTGADYGDNSFGVNYGRFSRHDPRNPKTNTVEFIHERKVNQFETPGRLRVADSGPARVVVEASWRDLNLTATQRYEFYAYQSFFRIVTTATPATTGLITQAQELVALDARFQVNRLSKTYPDFVGKRTGKNQPHFGWRYGYWIPPYVTFMTPDAFTESVSLVSLGARGVNLIRQGFWPPHRPSAGPCTRAQAEFVSTVIRPVTLRTVVFLHPGHQVVAEQLRRDLLLPPCVAAPERFQWTKGAAATGGSVRAWHHPLFPRRLPVIVTLPSGMAEGRAMVVLPPSVGKVKTVRVTEVTTAGQSLGDRPCRWLPEHRQVSWTVTAAGDGGPRRYQLYLSPQEEDPGPPWLRRAAPTAARLPRQTFESDNLSADWDYSGGALEEAGAHSGKRCLRLSSRPEGSPAVVVNRSFNPQPDTKYRVTFWAKALTEPCFVRTNFFADARYDFPQLAMPVAHDGKWRQCQLVLRVGAFPPAVQPRLRFWVLGGDGAVLIDDVSAEPLPGSAAHRAVVRVGAVESRAGKPARSNREE